MASEANWTGVRIQGDADVIFSALLDAQASFDQPRLTSTADGGQFSYDYAPLEEILRCVREPLNEAGFVLLQPVEETGDHGIRLRTILAHESGGRVETSVRVPDPDGMHDLGSSITYLRRYCLTALLGVRAEADDDAHRAQATAQESRGSAGSDPASESQRNYIKGLKSKLEDAEIDWRPAWREAVGDTMLEELTKDEASNVIDALQDARDDGEDGEE